MSRLFLYSIFHGNLKFSSIPEDRYGHIIDTCYWPIIDLVSEFENLKIGVEFPSSTLRYISEIDPVLIEELRRLASDGRIEVLASGAVQSLFPLIPKELNDKNLGLGMQEYKEILGVTPSIGYLNEQAFSGGLPAIYLKNNIRSLVMMWEWLVKFSGKGVVTDYSPQVIEGSDGSKVNAIMNSYIAFQKFQRYIGGEINLDAYVKYILKQEKANVESCFPFYGSDWEVFGYKNVILGTENTGKEVERFRKFVERVEAEPSLSFATPSEVLKKFKPAKGIRVDSPQAAIYLKKQDKFIVSRWAVCGRDNSLSNSLCYNIYKKVRTLKELSSMSASNIDINSFEKQLIDSWASDNRTHTTETKYTKFRNQLGNLAERIDASLFDALQMIAKERDRLFLINSADSNWNRIPVEIKVHFAPRKYWRKLRVFVDGRKEIHQVEEPQFYKDGSLRSAKLVLAPHIQKKSVAALEIDSEKSSKENIDMPDKNVKEVETDKLYVSFLPNRGATIDKLLFKEIHDEPMAGWIEHGYYNDTQLSADFYTGHMVAFDRNNRKVTDLVRVSQIHVPEGESPIRVPVRCMIKLPMGSLEKSYYVYNNQSRVDIDYRFDMAEFKPASFRLGIVTLNPSAYDKSTLGFSTTNGGRIERFSVQGTSIAYDESVDPRVSSHGCLGATEGWIDIGDSKRGITVFSDKSKCYSVPLLNYRETDESFFYRVYNSISELDDTTMTWWKGLKTVGFSYLGRKGGIESNVDTCALMSRGLTLFSTNPSIRLE